MRRRGSAKSATERSKPSLQRRQRPMPNARRPSKWPATLPNNQNVMRCLRLNRRRPAMPVTPHGRQPRSSGGEATSPKDDMPFTATVVARVRGRKPGPGAVVCFAQCPKASSNPVAHCKSDQRRRLEKGSSVGRHRLAPNGLGYVGHPQPGYVLQDFVSSSRTMPVTPMSPSGGQRLIVLRECRPYHL